MDLPGKLLRALYSAVLYLLAPLIAGYLLWRGRRLPDYRQRWDERGSRYASTTAALPVDVWLHAASVGEVNAAAPVVNALRASHPRLRWLVTTLTPTGSQRVRALWGEGVQHVYLPYDLPGAVARFLDRFRPGLALVMETELWPNLWAGCHERAIPAYLLNARLSARSLRRYRVLGPLLAGSLRSVRRIGVQSREDGLRFVALGAQAGQVVDTGNLKFDIAAPAGLDALVTAFREHVRQRPVWIAASTHPDEEAAVLQLHRRLRQRWPGLLLVWAPRHPERFPRVAEQARALGLQVATRSGAQWPGAGDDVFVVDTLGELMKFYACADVAFVGGSLQAIGGHNLLEAAAVGTPMVTGPHLHNFAEISKRLEDAGALRIGHDAEAVGRQVEALLADPAERAAMAAAGYQLVEQGRGALARTLDMIAADIPASG